MVAATNFTAELEAKVVQQLKSQRVGYLLGAGSSYLNGTGYPLAFELWDLIKGAITDTGKRDDIQAKLDGGANGMEQALDLLDAGGATDTPYRHIVTTALAELLMCWRASNIDHLRALNIDQGMDRRRIPHACG